MQARHLFASTIVVAACALAGLVAAGAPRQRGVPTPSAGNAPQVQLQPGTAFILGRVVEAGRGAAVPNANVTLRGPALGASQTSVFSDGTPAGPRDATTDAQGNFLFRNLPAGTYQLSATASGFVNGAYGQGRPFQLPRTLDVIGNVDVRSGEKVAGVTITLWRLAGVIGTVVDDAGEPMVGVPVTVLHRITDWGGAYMTEATTVQTDDRGTYHADVTPGDYVVAVLAPPVAVPASVTDGVEQAVAAGAAPGTGILESLSSSNVAPMIGDGVRVGSWIVASSRASAPPPLPATVRGGVPELYLTTYYPASRGGASATVLTLESGQEKTGINLQLQRQAAHRVSGRVSGPDGSGANVGVRLVVQDPATNTQMNPMFMNDGPQAITDASGTFTFFGVTPGAYTLRVMKNSRTSDTVLWALDAVTVGESDLRDLSVELRPGSRISGHVAFDGSGQTPPAAMLSRISFTPRALPGSNGAYVIAPRTVFGATDQNGVFSLGQLVPGPYMLIVAGVPSGWALKAVTTGGHDVLDSPFTLGASDLDDMVVTLTDRVPRVVGTLRDGDGRPNPSATVGIFPVDKAHWRLPGMPSPRVRTTSPDRNAGYSMDGLPAGEYLIVAVDHPVDFSDPAVLTSLMGSATHVSVVEGESRTLNLTVVAVK